MPSDLPKLSDLAAVLEAASKGPWCTWPELEPAAWKELEEKGVFEAELFDTEGNIAEFDAYDLAQNRANARLAAQAPDLAAELIKLREALPGRDRSAKIEGYALSLHASEHDEPTCKFCIEFWDEIMEQAHAALPLAPGPAGERQDG